MLSVGEDELPVEDDKDDPSFGVLGVVGDADEADEVDEVRSVLVNMPELEFTLEAVALLD